jgi:hypothetical protein
MMNPAKVRFPLTSLAITSSLLLLLIGCESLPTESNPPAVVPNPQPGAPIPGGLQIAYAHATTQLADTGHWKTGTVNVHFNGAATTAGFVVVEALPPGRTSSLYTHGGEAKFVPGQTDVQVQIGVIVEKPAEIPLKVLIKRSSAVFQTMTHYSGNR